MREIPLQFDDNKVEKGTGREALARYPDPEHVEPVEEVHTMPTHGIYSDSAFCDKTERKANIPVHLMARMGSGGHVYHPPRGDVYFDRAIGKPKVYVLTMVWTPYLKIGVSNNVMARRASLSGPMDVDIRHVRHCRSEQEAYEIEQLAHSLLSDFHHRREWFCATVDMAVMAVGAAAQAVEVRE